MAIELQTIVYMDKFWAKAAQHKPDPKTVGTLIGISAIPLWATWPLFAVISAESIPPLQFTALIFGIASVTLFGLRAPTQRQPTANVRDFRNFWLPISMVSFGIFVSNFLFLLAARYMPPAEANLIGYTWPLMVVLLAAPFGLIALRRHHFVSIALGLIGAGLVIGPSMSVGSLTGIVLAAVSGLSWAIYCVYRLHQEAEAPNALAGGLALSAVISGLLHFCFEPTVMPVPSALLSAVLTGIIPLALGNLIWDRGMREGNRVLLAVSAYATPLVSALILIAFGFTEATLGLLLGGTAIVLGGIISARK
jgi:drug/metabolite transporter (DMT)-like permease